MMRLTQGLSRAVLVRPDGVATIDGARVKTWREVHERVGRIAGGLRARGVDSGDRVAVLANNCDLFFEAYYGVLWSGAVIVPLNTRLAVTELAFQLRDAGAKAIFFGEEYRDQAAALREQLEDVDLWIGFDGAEGADIGLEALIADAAPVEDALRRDDDLAGIFYTGGTTGLPKGVMLSHTNLVAMATNLIMALKIDEDCVNFHSAPMFHLADIGIFFTTMVAGTHVFLRRFEEERMLEEIERHRVTHCFTVPAVVHRMAKHPRADTADLSCLRMIGYGGSPMPVAVFELARERFPHVDFVQGYGMTEMSAATYLSPRYHRKGADPELLKSVGQPLFGYELKIVDADGREAPRGVTGEIVGRGANVMLGYWNRPEETARALRGGWMHSQDAGFMDENGFIFITDRLKDMIVSGAENVYSIEVENVIHRHPAVDECTVIGVPDDVWGERVHAIVVPRDGQTLSLDELIAFCRKSIAGYKCPKSLELSAAPLPRSAAGKVLKQELRKGYWAGRKRAI